MKIFLAILAFLSLQAKADYNSPGFKVCYDLVGNGSPNLETLRACEKYTDEQLAQVSDPRFGKCLKFIGYQPGGWVPPLTFASCIAIADNNNLAVFESPELKICMDYNNKVLPYTDATNYCLLKFYSEHPSAPKQGSATSQLNEKLQFPEGSQIFLRADVEIPSQQGCGSPKDSNNSVRCYVCQKRSSRNGVIYSTESILKLGDVRSLDAGKKIVISLIDSDELDKIQCLSNEVIKAETSVQLTQILNNSGFGFNNAPSIRKSVGTGAQP